MSDTQSEQVLENNLITQLGTLGYDTVNLPDEAALLANLKRHRIIRSQCERVDYSGRQSLVRP